RRPPEALDHVRHGEGLARAGDALEHLPRADAGEAGHQLLDGPRLVAARHEVRAQSEGAVGHESLGAGTGRAMIRSRRARAARARDGGARGGCIPPRPAAAGRPAGDPAASRRPLEGAMRPGRTLCAAALALLVAPLRAQSMDEMSLARDFVRALASKDTAPL